MHVDISECIEPQAVPQTGPQLEASAADGNAALPVQDIIAKIDGNYRVMLELEGLPISTYDLDTVCLGDAVMA